MTCGTGAGWGAWGGFSAPSLHCRTIYRVAYRQAYRQVAQPVAPCCPGWSRANSHALGCDRGEGLRCHPRPALVLPQLPWDV